MDDRSNTLDEAILLAHEKRDGAQLASLYFEASELKQDNGESEAAAFLLTHAYVFALECGDARAAEFHRRLVEMGREAP